MAMAGHGMSVVKWHGMHLIRKNYLHKHAEEPEGNQQTNVARYSE
jgi:hypothetical protein